MKRYQYGHKQKMIKKFEFMQCTDEQKEIMKEFHKYFRALAQIVLDKVPRGDDRDDVIQMLRISNMLVNSAISHDWQDEINAIASQKAYEERKKKGFVKKGAFKKNFKKVDGDKK